MREHRATGIRRERIGDGPLGFILRAFMPTRTR